MKVSKTFLATILPITIGSVLFIAFFFLKDKFAIEPELEACERNELSAVVYLLFALVIIVVSSLYQMVLGNWILKRTGNKFGLNLLNSLVFGLIFTVIFSGMEIFNGKVVDLNFGVGFFIVMVLLGLLFSVLKSFTDNYLNKVG